MKKKYLFSLLLLLFPLTATTAQAQDTTEVEAPDEYIEIPQQYRLRVSFRDKKQNPYSLKRPQEFLSPKAIERRKRLGIKVDEYDLPVTPKYLRALEQNGCTIYNVSKWNNTAIVQVSDTACMAQIAQLPFVSAVKCVWIGPKELYVGQDADPFTLAALIPNSQKLNDSLEVLRRQELVNDTTKYKKRHEFYGSGFRQAEMLKADKLHEMGFRGEGMTIAVIDGGFHNADLVLPEVKILGTRNFVHPGYSVFFEPEDHGTMVLSTIGANQEGRLVGTAPGAQFYLLQSEDGNSEQMVEEDNWCAAVEYADSLGCDVISTSLGYYKFDEGINSHAYSDLDGQTAANSRAASRAASRGLLVLNSAGNEGDGTWKKIGFPADAKDIIAVGATNSKGVNTSFSSLGYTADGRVKPDAMAMGGRCATISESNFVRFVNGTSFSCPILAGAVTCLWQAFPNKRPTEIIKAVQQAGNFATHPNEVMGYGIPDLMKAYELLQK